MTADDRTLPWLRLWTDFPNDYRVCSVPEAMQARLVKLWCLHRRGLLVGAPVDQLAFELRLPAADVKETLAVLTAAGLLLADRTPRGWDKRQRQYDDAAARMRELRRARQTSDPSPVPSLREDKIRQEKKGDEQAPNACGTCSERESASPAEGRPIGSPEAGSPDGALIPLRDGSAFTPTPAQLAEWRAAFPHVDVEAELRHAAAWCSAAPERRKTRRGVARFAVGWFGRAKPTAPTRSAAAARDAAADRLAREAVLSREGAAR